MWSEILAAFGSLHPGVRAIIFLLMPIQFYLLGWLLERFISIVLRGRVLPGELPNILFGLIAVLSAGAAAGQLTLFLNISETLRTLAGLLLFLPSLGLIFGSHRLIRLFFVPLDSSSQQQKTGQLPDHYRLDVPYSRQVDDVRFESPIEEKFYRYWQQKGGSKVIELVYQYRVPKTGYRIDFVHLATQTAIELDGYEYHSSKKQFVADRQRQRTLERLGWRFIRFSGSEIMKNCSGCFEEVRTFIEAFKSPGRFSQLNESRLPALISQYKPRTREEVEQELNRVLCNTDYPVVGTKSIEQATLSELYEFAAWEIKDVMLTDQVLMRFDQLGKREVWLSRLEKAEQEEAKPRNHIGQSESYKRQKTALTTEDAIAKEIEELTEMWLQGTITEDELKSRRREIIQRGSKLQ